jgi:hypothetical protein
MDTNIFLNLVTSTACGAAAAAVTLITAEDTDKEVGVLSDCVFWGEASRDFECMRRDVREDGMQLVSSGLTPLQTYWFEPRRGQRQGYGCAVLCVCVGGGA